MTKKLKNILQDCIDKGEDLIIPSALPQEIIFFLAERRVSAPYAMTEDEEHKVVLEYGDGKTIESLLRLVEAYTKKG